MKSNVNAAILSLAIEQPCGGATICRRFEARYRGLLESGRQHIYGALAHLVRAGMLERIPLGFSDAVDEGEGYRATALGAGAYRRWLSEPIALSKLSRQETLIRLASTQPNDRAGALALMDRYEQVIFDLCRATPADPANLMDELVADERTDFAQAELRWIQRARQKLTDAGPSR